jgi:hypothetical protein
VAAFTDRTGTEWRLNLTLGDLRRARDLAGVDLNAAIKSDAALSDLLFSDPESLCKVLWVLCEKQAADRGLAPEGFAEVFDGPTVERAAVALAEAVIDFFPRSKIGAAMKANLRANLDRVDARVVATISTPSGPGTSSAG